MGIRKTTGGVMLRLYYVPDALNVLSLDEDWQIRDVFLKRVTLTANANTLCEATTIDVTYNDNGGAGLGFDSWAQAVAFLNETFRVELGLKGRWNISQRGLFVNYQNMEQFASGAIVVDQGVFEGAFGDEFH